MHRKADLRFYPTLNLILSRPLIILNLKSSRISNQLYEACAVGRQHCNPLMGQCRILSTFICIRYRIPTLSRTAITPVYVLNAFVHCVLSLCLLFLVCAKCCSPWPQKRRRLRTAAAGENTANTLYIPVWVYVCVHLCVHAHLLFCYFLQIIFCSLSLMCVCVCARLFCVRGMGSPPLSPKRGAASEQPPAGCAQPPPFEYPCMCVCVLCFLFVVTRYTTTWHRSTWPAWGVRPPAPPLHNILFFTHPRTLPALNSFVRPRALPDGQP